MIIKRFEMSLRWMVGAIAIACAVCLLATQMCVSAGAAPLGITKFTLEPTERTVVTLAAIGGVEIVNQPYALPFTQAGAHPWALTTVIDFTNEVIPLNSGGKAVVPTQDPKDVVTYLPPGLLGNPMAAPRCSLTFVTSNDEQCPADTQIGVYAVEEDGGSELLAPIVNVTPEKGQSAEFALENTAKGLIVPLLTARLVRTEEGYGFMVASNEIPMTGITHAELTFWGVPADPSHDPVRGLICRRAEVGTPLDCEEGGQKAGLSPVPFLTMPTDCSAGPERATVRADSWEAPGSIHEGHYSGYAEKQSTLPGATGCNVLQFSPSIEVRPDTLLADEPVGLNLGLQVPLSEKPEVNATPQLRDTVLTLPGGMSVSPSVVDGIQACDEFGPEGINITGPESEQIGLSGELQLAPGHCPDASVVGTAEAITPLLAVPVKGHVYLARPGCGSLGERSCSEHDAVDGNLYKLYLELGGTGDLALTGLHFKVPLETSANPVTGQLTTRALGTPQAPFSELKIHLNGGPRAPIDNPAVCGPAVSTSDFRPWSAPGITPQGLSMPGTPDATPLSFFDVQGCSSPPVLSPSFLAGTVSSQAGAFSSFTVNLSRKDREQYFKGIQLRTPPGLLGMLANVTLCGEPAANEGTCTEASKIGTTRVASGAGSHPFEIEGSVFLTDPYEGAPFGLSIVTHAMAGPFNLGLVVVRARVDIDPDNSTLIVTTDEQGPHAIPQIIFGVPLRLQHVTVNVDRSHFMFNPTNCKSLQIKASVSGNQGAAVNMISQYAAGGCRGLAFKPALKVTINGRTSRAKGASLDAKLTFPKDAFGKDANMARVKVSLPKQLPSRLTTLQKACLTQTFERNPAACPPGAIVGIAMADTPVLPRVAKERVCDARKRCRQSSSSVVGPVYFVSHGGESFPQLIIILQGDGVRVDLAGSTFINKAGITSSTFKAVPDVPISSFELYLPQGKGSALAASGNICAAPGKLKMPTEFVSQSGVVIRKTTQISVTGCGAKPSIRLKPGRTGK